MGLSSCVCKHRFTQAPIGTDFLGALVRLSDPAWMRATAQTFGPSREAPFGEFDGLGTPTCLVYAVDTQMALVDREQFSSCPFEAWLSIGLAFSGIDPGLRLGLARVRPMAR